MMTLENGMGELISRLGDHLKNEINLNHPVHSLDEIEGNIIFSVPASELAKLISKQDPLSAQRLLQIRYAPLVTATCFYKISSFRKVPPKGVGVLIPRGEDLRILGCLFNSSSFQNRVSRPDLTSLTVMIGGSMDPQAVHLSEIDLNDLIDRELKTLLGTTEPPERIQIKKWDRAIPTYSSDLYLAQNSLRNGFCASPGKLIFTNYSKEVSIRSIISAAQYI